MPTHYHTNAVTTFTHYDGLTQIVWRCRRHCRCHIVVVVSPTRHKYVDARWTRKRKGKKRNIHLPHRWWAFAHKHTQRLPHTTPATRTHIDILYINCIYHFLFPIWNSVWNFRLHNTHTEYTHHNRTCEPNRFVKPTTCVRKSNFQNCPNLRVALYYIHALCLWSTLYFSAPLSRKWSSFPPTLQNAVRYGRTTQQWLQRMQNVVNGANRKPRREHERRMVGRRVSVKETKSACNMGTKTRNRREKKIYKPKMSGYLGSIRYSCPNSRRLHNPRAPSNPHAILAIHSFCHVVRYPLMLALTTLFHANPSIVIGVYSYFVHVSLATIQQRRPWRSGSASRFLSLLIYVYSIFKIAMGYLR